MRISGDPRDQGFSPAFDKFIPTLDGYPMPHAITADEELGMVRVVAMFSSIGDPVEQVLFGKVTIHRLH